MSQHHPRPGDEYDPKTDQAEAEVLRELNADFYDEKSTLEALEKKEKELEARLEKIRQAKDRIARQGS